MFPPRHLYIFFKLLLMQNQTLGRKHYLQTWVHRCLLLASAVVIDRGDRACHLSNPESMANFPPLTLISGLLLSISISFTLTGIPVRQQCLLFVETRKRGFCICSEMLSAYSMVEYHWRPMCIMSKVNHCNSRVLNRAIVCRHVVSTL